MLLEDLLEEYILELEIQNYSQKTIISYKSRILNFCNYLKDKYNIRKVDDLKTINIKSYVAGLKQAQRKATYINSIIKSLQSFLKYAKEENFIENNPVIDVKLLKQNKPIINVFTEEEVSRMINTFQGNKFLPIRDKAILCVLVDCGIRCSELLKLKLNDISDNYITIKEPKNRKDRIVSLSPYTKKAITRYVRCREIYFINKTLDVDAHLFLSYRGKKLTVEAVERVVKIAGQKSNVDSGIRCSPHTCRHYYAVTSLKNNLDLYSLSVNLGHSDVSVTSRYLKGLKDKEIVEMSSKTSPLSNYKK
ncbi:MAG: tyrosine-type recombinase/integrase [Clostridium sp.]|uniref:tyrosine-type recombinase/integrase n=1 Tax=Clostridium sp. TaxID=1506 RepID=UPI0025C02D58|nr:tyrosine-type recombinase/integrase [Clostridium sp.]MCE5221639.1 tyrosine-type recombinase/integrase [Clostridium sp.]